MSTYNIYHCVPCQQWLDATHSITLSLKILCPYCSTVMVHDAQHVIPPLDIDTEQMI